MSLAPVMTRSRDDDRRRRLTAYQNHVGRLREAGRRLARRCGAWAVVRPGAHAALLRGCVLGLARWAASSAATLRCSSG
jgi:hypothetical protein